MVWGEFSSDSQMWPTGSRRDVGGVVGRLVIELAGRVIGAMSVNGLFKAVSAQAWSGSGLAKGTLVTSCGAPVLLDTLFHPR